MEDESLGWIKLHRKIQQNGFYKDSQYVHLWVHLLISANHKQVEQLWNGEMRTFKTGEFLTGRLALEKATGINQYKIERILNTLESAQQIAQVKSTKNRIIRIVKWEQYQSTSTTKRTTTAQQLHTNKNDKNEKKLRFSPKREEEMQNTNTTPIGDLLKKYKPDL